ncbi:MAG: AIPR family protein [Lamprobacter sp.]|uniref:AIPR family protein n=1 Tax=Lamprobacter sp. TaxID=3100796 RepID=UPI002B25A3B1|nr:AIPR family protein [Lamprobacter sp.]MEA3640230.1 AIPR family protein [Lamprobacter sp.]
MELEEFAQQLRCDLASELADRSGEGGDLDGGLVFAELVMHHMAEFGMTFEHQICHYTTQIRNAKLRISGFAFSEDNEQMDLFVVLYDGAESIQPIPKTETLKAAEQCVRFLSMCADGTMLGRIDEREDAYALALIIKAHYQSLDQVRIFVLTDRQANITNFKPREVMGKTVKLEVMDIARLHRHWSAGKPRDELVVDFKDVSGSALPCVWVPNQIGEYDYALTVIPGEALRFLYEKYGARLLEANVRSFLSGRGKVNMGIRDTLRDEPERFMAYNNGIVLVADEARIGRSEDGSPAILWLRGMQIVNGGQTTASIYFTKRKDPGVDLSNVQVPAKVIVLRTDNPAAEEAMITDVSRYANSQNAVRQSDLSANKPFHVRLETLANSTILSDGVGRWFYERTAGSYNTLLAREGGTPAKLRNLKRDVIPPARKITKTDLAKYLNTWDQQPDIVSLGAQKNFARFMDRITESDAPLPEVDDYKRMIAKAILFKKIHSQVRGMFPAFQGNVAVYLVAVIANRIGERIDLERIWTRQDVSDKLLEQAQVWATEVNRVLHQSANGRMISEWAKKADCWEKVRAASYSKPIDGIPELR